MYCKRCKKGIAREDGFCRTCSDILQRQKRKPQSGAAIETYLPKETLAQLERLREQAFLDNLLKGVHDGR